MYESKAEEEKSGWALSCWPFAIRLRTEAQRRDGDGHAGKNIKE
jgi:hypothetical protein